MDLVDTARNGVQSFLDGKDGENPIEAQYLLTFFGAKRTPANKDATSVKGECPKTENLKTQMIHSPLQQLSAVP